MPNYSAHLQDQSQPHTKTGSCLNKKHRKYSLNGTKRKFEYFHFCLCPGAVPGCGILLYHYWSLSSGTGDVVVWHSSCKQIYTPSACFSIMILKSILHYKYFLPDRLPLLHFMAMFFLASQKAVFQPHRKMGVVVEDYLLFWLPT